MSANTIQAPYEINEQIIQILSIQRYTKSLSSPLTSTSICLPISLVFRAQTDGRSGADSCTRPHAPKIVRNKLRTGNVLAGNAGAGEGTVAATAGGDGDGDGGVAGAGAGVCSDAGEDVTSGAGVSSIWLSLLATDTSRGLPTRI